ncbi:MAG: cystathionine beta-lyase, partial [Duncaniella sp.]|nr:cystathionine beta-lyase [Duncaniella sp.]
MITMYDFDKIIDRRGTGALKLEVLGERYGDPDLLPLWVADMDFETPHFITDALRRRLDHSLFGYTVEPADYWPSVMDWIRDRHGWDVEREWLTYIPGIVKGIGMAINVFVKPDEKVIIQPPVYHPFRLTPEGNGREVVNNP